MLEREALPECLVRADAPLEHSRRPILLSLSSSEVARARVSTAAIDFPLPGNRGRLVSWYPQHTRFITPVPSGTSGYRICVPRIITPFLGDALS